MRRYWILIFLLSALIMGSSCEKEDGTIPSGGVNTLETGTLHVWFKISHPWLSEEDIVRAGLHVAKNAFDIYRGAYLYSANVSDGQENYYFYLEPGTYYYEAIISCKCGGDTCSAAGFAGNQWGTRHTMDRFEIKREKVTQVIPTFQ